MSVHKAFNMDSKKRTPRQTVVGNEMWPSFPLQQRRRIAAPQAFCREPDRTWISSFGCAFATCFFEISFPSTGSLYRDYNFERSAWFERELESASRHGWKLAVIISNPFIPRSFYAAMYWRFDNSFRFHGFPKICDTC